MRRPRALQQIFGWVFAPVAWSLGVPWRDAATIGNLLGTRMVLNEFIAFSQLGPLKDSARSAVVHHRDVRAVRLRQLRVDRHSDRRHRRAGADAARRSGATGPARDVRRDAGQLRHGDHRGLSPVTWTRERTTTSIGSPKRQSGCATAASAAATWRSCWAPASARSPTRWPTRLGVDYGEIPHWPASQRHRPCRTTGRRHGPRPPRCWRCRAARTSTRATTCAP